MGSTPVYPWRNRSHLRQVPLGLWLPVDLQNWNINPSSSSWDLSILKLAPESEVSSMSIFNQPACDSNDVMFTFLVTWKVRMVFTNENKILVKVWRQDKGYSVKNVKVIFWQAMVGSALARLRWRQWRGGFCREEVYGSGRKCTTRASKNIDAVKELVLDQKDAHRTHFEHKAMTLLWTWLSP